MVVCRARAAPVSGTSNAQLMGISSMKLTVLAMFGLPGGTEWIVIGVIALLIFGRRLPDVARSVGKSIVEFKKGLRDVKDDIDTRSQIEGSQPPTFEAKSDSAGDAASASKPPNESTPSSN